MPAAVDVTSDLYHTRHTQLQEKEYPDILTADALIKPDGDIRIVAVVELLLGMPRLDDIIIDDGTHHTPPQAHVFNRRT